MLRDRGRRQTHVYSSSGGGAKRLERRMRLPKKKKNHGIQQKGIERKASKLSAHRLPSERYMGLVTAAMTMVSAAVAPDYLLPTTLLTHDRASRYEIAHESEATQRRGRACKVYVDDILV